MFITPYFQFQGLLLYRYHHHYYIFTITIILYYNTTIPEAIGTSRIYQVNVRITEHTLITTGASAKYNTLGGSRSGSPKLYSCNLQNYLLRLQGHVARLWAGWVAGIRTINEVKWSRFKVPLGKGLHWRQPFNQDLGPQNIT